MSETPVTPRPAAVGLVMREGGELLMVRRNLSLRFMPGHHVFPGGGVKREEGAANVINAPDDDIAQRIHAAAREVFEEAGILCTEGELPGVADRREAQEAILKKTETFDEILERFSLTIDAQRFEQAGHWITPPPSPIRFNTNYFLFRMDDGQEPHFVEGEIIGLDWFTAREARKRWHLGEIELSTPVSLTLHTLSAAPRPKALEILNRSKEILGDPKRLEIRRGVSFVPIASRTIPPATETNCVLIGETELYVIDPAPKNGEEQAHLKRHLDLFVELGAAVKAVLLTHSHHDHTDGVPFVRDTYGAPVWAHEAVAPNVDFAIDRHLEDGDVLVSSGDPDWRLRVIHTPGHDPGHLCFLEETTNTLVCGDMMANPGTIVISEQHGGDMTQFIESLEGLMKLDAGVLIPAHGMSMDDATDKLKGHRDHRLWREEKVKAALDSAGKTFPEVLARAYDDVPKESLPLAEHSLRAHLTRLGVTLAE